MSFCKKETFNNMFLFIFANTFIAHLLAIKSLFVRIKFIKV